MNTKSSNFSGDPKAILSEIRSFLSSVKAKNTTAKNFDLVHALIFSKDMSEKDIHEFNDLLSLAYRDSGFSVLGGDTSAGLELNIFISTIVH
ncbi:MAG: hypothetical protein ACXVCE_01060 [Bacteriovorax sp.]